MSGSVFEVGSWVEERQLLRGSRDARGGRCGVVMARSHRDTFVDVLIVNVLQLCTQSTLKTYGQVRLKVSNLRPFHGTGKCGLDQLKLLFAEGVSALGEGEEDAKVMQRSMGDTVKVTGCDDERQAGDPTDTEATAKDSTIPDTEHLSTQLRVKDKISTSTGSALIGSPEGVENFPNQPSLVTSKPLAIAGDAQFSFPQDGVVVAVPYCASEGGTPQKRRRRNLQERISSPRKHPYHCLCVDCFTRPKIDVPIACHLRVQWWRNGKMKEIKGKGGTQKHFIMMSSRDRKSVV